MISGFLLLYLFVQLYAEQLFGIFAPNKDGAYQKPRSVSKTYNMNMIFAVFFDLFIILQSIKMK